MEVIGSILENIVVFQIFTNLIKITIGAGLCFGALKWRRGLLTTTAIGWGLVLGILIAIPIGEAGSGAGAILCVIVGAIVLPILTYTVPGVNRFILGFVVGSKLLYMLTTVLIKADAIEFATAFILPLIIGTVIGLGLMAWTKMRVSAFVLSCSFIGSAGAAAAISELIRCILYGVTGDFGYIYDPADFIFNLFKIELTDVWTLIAIIPLMFFGIRRQIEALKEHNVPLDTPLIGFENPLEDNGVIKTDKGDIHTLK